MSAEIQALVLGPGEGRVARTAGTGSTAIGAMVEKASAEATHGAYALREATVPAGQPLVQSHIHHAMEEGFYVLEGELTFQVGQHTTTAPAGSFVLVPRGVPHTFGNPSTHPARALFFFSPPAFARFFEELAALRAASPTGQVDRATLAALAAEYDTEFLNLPAMV